METASTYKFVNKSVFSQTKVILIQLLDYMSSLLFINASRAG